MTDKMMRMAGRSDDGLAKALRSDSLGNVSIVSDGNDVKEHIFHEDRSTTGSGAFLTVGNKRSLRIEISGTATKVKIEFKAIIFDDAWKGVYGQNVSTGILAKETTGKNEIWQFDITGYKRVYMIITELSGGTVTVKGTVSSGELVPIYIEPPKEDHIFRHEFYNKRTTSGGGINLITNINSGYTKAFVHFWGSATARRIEFKGIMEDDGFAGIYGFNVLDGYRPAKETTGTGREIWLFDGLEAYKGLSMQLVSVSGGDVTAMARVVKYHV